MKRRNTSSTLYAGPRGWVPVRASSSGVIDRMAFSTILVSIEASEFPLKGADLRFQLLCVNLAHPVLHKNYSISFARLRDHPDRTRIEPDRFDVEVLSKAQCAILASAGIQSS